MIKHFETHAANERTFLSWVRTVIAIDGFGILIARTAPLQAPPTYVSAALIGAGMLLIAFAGLRFHYLRRRINADDLGTPFHWSFGTIMIAMIVSLIILLVTFAIHGMA